MLNLASPVHGGTRSLKQALTARRRSGRSTAVPGVAAPGKQKKGRRGRIWANSATSSNAHVLDMDGRAQTTEAASA